MEVSNDYENTVQWSVSTSFNDEATADLKISVEGKLIHVHKALLKIR